MPSLRFAYRRKVQFLDKLCLRVYNARGELLYIRQRLRDRTDIYLYIRTQMWLTRIIYEMNFMHMMMHECSEEKIERVQE